MVQAKLRCTVAREVLVGTVTGCGVDWVRGEGGRWRGIVIEAGGEVKVD